MILPGLGLFFLINSFSEKPESFADKSSDAKPLQPTESIPHDCDHCSSFEASKSLGEAEVEKLSQISIEPTYLEEIASQHAERVQFTLPNQDFVTATIEKIEREADSLVFGGSITAPKQGIYYFHYRYTSEGVLKMEGLVRYYDNSNVFIVEENIGGGYSLVEKPSEDVVCVDHHASEHHEHGQHHEHHEHGEHEHFIDDEHPTLSEPGYQNSVPRLESYPGATAVLYLDFDGESGYFYGWGEHDLGSFGFSDDTIRNIWARVAEDFAPFSINVTTDLEVYEAAPKVASMRCIITPDDSPYPGAGGVSQIHTFEWFHANECFCFYGSPLARTALVISHELGHTLGLGHDGKGNSEYYGGHGPNGDPVSWTPIMGNGSKKVISQWSQGEYTNASNTQDDLALIIDNNEVGYRTDDHGGDYVTGSELSIASDGGVRKIGVISETGEKDAFRFQLLSSGQVNLNVDGQESGPNLDIKATLHNDAGTVLYESNPEDDPDALFSDVNLPAGNYYLCIEGVGNGDPLVLGYPSYGSLGYYKIEGTITNAISQPHFIINGPSPVNTVVGTVLPLNDHGASLLEFSIISSTVPGAFTIGQSDGEITVLDPALIRYYDLATLFNSISQVELVVGVTNTSDASLNEEIAVLVSLDPAPYAEDMSVNFFSDLAVGFSLPGVDEDGFAFIYTNPSHGILTGTAPHLVYTQTSATAMSDSFTYYTTYNGLTSEIKTITLNSNDTQLLAHWKLDDGGGTVLTDSSGNGHDATLVSGEWVATKHGTGLKFDGLTSKANLPVEPFNQLVNQNPPADGFSISLLMRIDPATPLGYGLITYPLISGVNTLGYTARLEAYIQYSYSSLLTIQSLRTRWNASADPITLKMDTLSLSHEPEDIEDHWVHFVLIKDVQAEVLKIYRNGELWVQELSNDGVLETFQNIYLGTDFSSGAHRNYFRGVIDEVKLYGVALDDAEVSSLYQTTLNAYDQWLADNNLPLNTDFYGDLDDDGQSNGLEFIMLSDPNEKQSYGSILTDGYDAQAYSFSFYRNINASNDTIQTFQYSTDLVNWNDMLITSPTDPNIDFGESGGLFEKVTIEVPVSEIPGSKAFGRLLIEYPGY